MTRVTIDRLSQFVDQTVTLLGWLYNKRSSKKLHFLEVRDGTGIVQCIVSLADVGAEAFEAAGKLTQESSLELEGRVQAHPKHAGQFEVAVSNLRPIHTAHEYPITPKEHGTDFLMDHRHLWLRSKRQHAILRVRHAIV